MKKILVALMLILSLTSCEDYQRQVKIQQEFDNFVDEYEVIDKSTSVGEHYQLFSMDQYHHTRVRTEYNVIFKSLVTGKILTARDINIKYYYQFEKGKVYSITNGDMCNKYRVPRTDL